MKKIGLFSLVGVVVMLSAILFSEKDVLANSLALSDVEPSESVPCFKDFIIDPEENPDQDGSLWAKANRCSDCKSYFFTHVSEQSNCIPTIEGTIQ